MSNLETPPITDVSGGSHDPVVRRAARLAADYAAARGLAETYDAAGGKMRSWGATGAKTMANGDLLESSVLSPTSFARSEAAVLVATTGPDGIFVGSVGWETDAILIRVTVAAIEEKDQIARQTHGGTRLRPRPDRRYGARRPGPRRPPGRGRGRGRR